MTMYYLKILSIGLYALAIPCLVLSGITCGLHFAADSFFDYDIRQILSEDANEALPIGGLVGSFAILGNVGLLSVLLCLQIRENVIRAIIYPIHFTAIQVAMLGLVIDTVYLIVTGTNIIRFQMQQDNNDPTINGELSYCIFLVSMNGASCGLLLLMIIIMTISVYFLQRSIKFAHYRTDEDDSLLDADDDYKSQLLPQRIHLIAFTVSGSFFGLICMILSIAIGDMWNKMISVGIVWYLPLWCICILVSFNIQTDIWIPTCYICSIFAACVSLAGFGYEIASLVSVVDDFGSRMRVPDCIYITSSVIMLIDLLAVMVLLCIVCSKLHRPMADKYFPTARLLSTGDHQNFDYVQINTTEETQTIPTIEHCQNYAISEASSNLIDLDGNRTAVQSNNSNLSHHGSEIDDEILQSKISNDNCTPIIVTGSALKNVHKNEDIEVEAQFLSHTYGGPPFLN